MKRTDRTNVRLIRPQQPGPEPDNGVQREKAGELDGGAEERFCSTRRSFLLAGAGSLVTLSLVPLPSLLLPSEVQAKVVAYPAKIVGKLADLRVDEPQYFLYPDEDKVYAQCFVVKLGRAAGFGAGPERDIVAFSSLCTHMGGPVGSVYNSDYKVAGPCPTHLTTFDLTRHGIVVAGHATESLPQVTLEVRGESIVATGVLGLVFGRPDNLPGRAK